MDISGRTTDQFVVTSHETLLNKWLNTTTTAAMTNRTMAMRGEHHESTADLVSLLCTCIYTTKQQNIYTNPYTHTNKNTANAWMGVGKTIETSHSVCVNAVQIWCMNKEITVKRNRNIFTQTEPGREVSQMSKATEHRKEIFFATKQGPALRVLWQFRNNYS